MTHRRHPIWRSQRYPLLRTLLVVTLPLWLAACPPKRAFHWNPSGTTLAVDLPETGLLAHADGSIIRETALVGPWMDDRRMVVVQRNAARDWSEYSSFLSEEQKHVARSLVSPFAKAFQEHPDPAAYLKSAIHSSQEGGGLPVPANAGLSLLLTHSIDGGFGDEREFLTSVALAQMLESSKGTERDRLTDQVRKAGILTRGSSPEEGFHALPIFEIRVIDSEPGSDLPPRTLHRGILPPESVSVSLDAKTVTFSTRQITGPQTFFLSSNAHSSGPEGSADEGPVLSWLPGGRSVLHSRPNGIRAELGQTLEGVGQIILHLDHTGSNKTPLAHHILPSDDIITPAARWGANGLILASVAQRLPALSVDKAIGLFVIDRLPSRPEDPNPLSLNPLEPPGDLLRAINFSGNIVSNPSGTVALLLGKNGEIALMEHASLRTRTIVADRGLKVLPAWRSDTEFTYAVAAGNPRGSHKRAEVLLGTLDDAHKILSSKWPDAVLDRLAK